MTLEAYYGLPAEVQFCTKCVISNQRPSSAVEFKHTRTSKKVTIGFDEEGVCDACRYAEFKDRNVDWKKREEELLELLDHYRKDDGSYDCLVPGSGGKDSTFAAHVLKYKYDMNPLTVTWAPNIYTDVGWRNFQHWLNAGFDNFLFTPNGKIRALLTRLSFQNLFHPFQTFMLGQKNYAPRMALKENIPLVFYGESEAEYGNPLAETESSKREHKYYSSDDPESIHLAGVSLQDLIQKYQIPRGELEPYFPVDPILLEKQEINVRYLGYYLKWDPQEAYYYSVDAAGFEANPERTEGTYSKYNSLDDRIDGFHYWTTHVKFGIGRATYDAAQEIRNHKITREEGVALVKKFDGEFPQRYFSEILTYIGMTEDEFLQLADTFRSPHLWERDDGDWKLRHTVWMD